MTEMLRRCVDLDTDVPADTLSDCGASRRCTTSLPVRCRCGGNRRASVPQARVRDNPDELAEWKQGSECAFRAVLEWVAFEEVDSVPVFKGR